MSTIFKSEFFKKSFAAILISALVPTVISIAGSYLISTKQIQKQLENAQKAQVNQLDAYMTEQFNSLEQIMIRWTFNRTFTDVKESNDIFKDSETIASLSGLLTLIKNSHSLINDVGFYDEDNQVIYSESVGIVYLDSEQSEYVKSIVSEPKSVYYVDSNNIDAFKKTNHMDTLLLAKINNSGDSNDGVIIVSIDKKFVDRLLDRLSPDFDQASFIIRSDGKTYYNTENGASQQEKLINGLKSEIDSMDNKDIVFDDFLFKFEGEDYSVAYGTCGKSGWTYVTATPLSKILSPVRRMSQLLSVISILSLIILLGISIFFSRKIYKPVNQLTNFVKKGLDDYDSLDSKDEFKFIRRNVEKINGERQVLKSYVDVNRIILKEGFLLQLIQKHLYHFSEQELRKTMERIGWKLTSGDFSAVFIKLFITEENSSSGDEQLATYAALNIVEEAVDEHSGVLGVINLHDLAVVILLQHQKLSEISGNEQINLLCKTILKRLSGFLRMQVVIGVSKPVSETRELPDAYNEALGVIRYRDVNLKEEIIYAEDLLQKEEVAFSYPLLLEAEIVHDISMGMIEEVSEKIGLLAEYITKKSGKEFVIQQSMLHLLGNIMHTMIQSGSDITKLYKGQNLYEQLCHIEKPNDMVEWFKQTVMTPYALDMRQTQDQKYSQMVNRVTKYIQQNYMKDISLDICADELGIPAKRLSVIFQKITESNFIDYVTNVRINMAKELLKNTDDGINEIAVKVGYQASYFNRSFKKHEGITPGEYRQGYR